MEEKVIEAIRGDNQAFDELILLLEVPLYRVAKAILQDDHDCADAIQEAILKAYRSLSQLKQPLYFQTWLTRILINECHELLRRKQKTVQLSEQRELATKEAELERVEMRQILQQLEPSFLSSSSIITKNTVSKKSLRSLESRREQSNPGCIVHVRILQEA